MFLVATTFLERWRCCSLETVQCCEIQNIFSGSATPLKKKGPLPDKRSPSSTISSVHGNEIILCLASALPLCSSSQYPPVTNIPLFLFSFFSISCLASYLLSFTNRTSTWVKVNQLVSEPHVSCAPLVVTKSGTKNHTPKPTLSPP